MNKTDYLRKKGMLPPEDYGTLYCFMSTPDGVGDIIALQVWETKKSGRATVMNVHDGPYEARIDDGEVLGKNEGYGSGFGDLWSWTWFYSLDRSVLETARAAESERVDKKYGPTEEEANMLRFAYWFKCVEGVRVSEGDTVDRINGWGNVNGYTTPSTGLRVINKRELFELYEKWKKNQG